MKNIEDIKEGDYVLQKDPITGEVGYKKVLRTFVNTKEELVHIEVEGTLIETTKEHPFWVVGYGFKNAEDIEAGDYVVTAEGIEAEITFVETVEVEPTTYNFEVEDWHTYFVSDVEIWVHNKCQKNLPSEEKLKDAVSEWARYEQSLAPSNRKLRGFNTATVVYDAGKDSYYYGMNKGVKLSGGSLNSELASWLPEKSLEGWKDVANCAEVDAVNQALNAGGNVNQLYLYTIDLNNGFTPKEMCNNCVYTFSDRVAKVLSEIIERLKNMEFFINITIRGRMAYLMCSLKKLIIFYGYTVEDLMLLLETMWEITTSDSVDDCMYKICEYIPYCVIYDSVDNLDDAEYITVEEFLYCKKLYNDIPNEIIEMCDIIYHLGETELYTAIRDNSPKTLKILNEGLEILRRNNIEFLDTEPFKIFKICDNDVWGNAVNSDLIYK